MKMFYDKVYGKTIDGIKDLLRFLLSEPSTGRALKRQVAFLFFFLFFLLFYFLFSVFLGKLFSSFLMLFFSLFSFFHRQVAFLFDFEEIEHTTVLGLTLQVIHINVLNIGHNFWSLGHSLEKPSPWYSFWRDWPHCDPSIIMFLSWHVVHQYGPH